MAITGTMKIEQIPGESKRSGHEGEIVIDAMSFGAARSVSRSGGKRESGRAEISSVSLSKATDASSPYLYKACMNATNLKDVVITFRKDAGDEAIDYLIVTLTNTLVESFQTGGSMGGDSFTDSVTLSFEKITYKYHQQGDELTKDKPHEVAFDLLALA